MDRLLIWPLAIVLTLTVVGCSAGEATPAFEPLPTPTVPPGFVSFTDETSGFSIQYPQDWELFLSLMSETEEEGKAFLLNKDPDLPVGNVRILFAAGLRVGERFEPSTIIVAESLPSEMSVFEFYEAATLTMSDLWPGYRKLKEVSTIVGDRQVVIGEFEADVDFVEPGFEGKASTVILAATSGRVGWNVTCTASIGSPPTSEVLETCNAVVRTFRLLK